MYISLLNGHRYNQFQNDYYKIYNLYTVLFCTLFQTLEVFIKIAGKQIMLSHISAFWYENNALLNVVRQYTRLQCGTILPPWQLVWAHVLNPLKHGRFANLHVWNPTKGLIWTEFYLNMWRCFWFWLCFSLKRLQVQISTRWDLFLTVPNLDACVTTQIQDTENLGSGGCTVRGGQWRKTIR